MQKKEKGNWVNQLTWVRQAHYLDYISPAIMFFPLLCICFVLGRFFCFCFFISGPLEELYHAIVTTPAPNKPSLVLVFSYSPDDSLIDKKNFLALPPPVLPLTRLHALFIEVVKSHIGLAWIVCCLKQGGRYQSHCRGSLHFLAPNL